MDIQEQAVTARDAGNPIEETSFDKVMNTALISGAYPYLLAWIVTAGSHTAEVCGLVSLLQIISGAVKYFTGDDQDRRLAFVLAAAGTVALTLNLPLQQEGKALLQQATQAGAEMVQKISDNSSVPFRREFAAAQPAPALPEHKR